MENRLEALISAYNIKPKQLQKKRKPAKEKPGPIKQSSSMNNIKLNSRKVLLQKLESKSSRKQSTNSVQPSQRANSEMKYLKKEKIRHNSSLDDDLVKLENLTVRNSNARLDLISIQERMIELGLQKDLNPIVEIDESHNEDNLNFDHSIDSFIGKIRSRQEVKQKMKSLKDLLIL
jgi:hypothetical protein